MIHNVGVADVDSKGWVWWGRAIYSPQEMLLDYPRRWMKDCFVLEYMFNELVSEYSFPLLHLFLVVTLFLILPLMEKKEIWCFSHSFCSLLNLKTKKDKDTRDFSCVRLMLKSFHKLKDENRGFFFYKKLLLQRDLNHMSGVWVVKVICEPNNTITQTKFNCNED